MTNELLPCPFCGSNQILIKHCITSIDYIECQGCYIEASYSDCIESAKEIWNTRASGWISCKDKKKPVINETILLTDGYDVYPGFLDSMYEYRLSDRELCSDCSFDVIYWQELPTPPKETE